eukprot:m.3026 g.3026  ORF g.3026 m.3026 type:complete len:128 (+) comp2007_c0_seq1:181-564(+)
MSSQIEETFTLNNFFLFQATINTFSDMWITVWTWNILAFGVSHLVAGCVAYFRFRKDVWWAWALPLLFLVMSGLICVTAGLVTSVLVAAVYTQHDFSMTTTEAFGWGVGLFVLYSFASFSAKYHQSL